MGRGGGPSLRERAINQSIHAHNLQVIRALKPPFTCPQCSRESFNIKKIKHKDGSFHWRGNCKICGLVRIPEKFAMATIDAYNFIYDELRGSSSK